MKIAVWHNLPSGGGKRALFHHVEGLLAQGHKVEAWCPPTADQTYLPLSQLCRENVVPLASRAGGRKVRWRPVSAMTARLGAMDEHCLLCAADIQSKGFDLLFANSCAAFAVSPIARHVQIPSVIYLGEPFRHLYECMPGSQHGAGFPWAALPERAGQSRSRYFKSQLADLLGKRALRLQVREEIRNAKAFSTILVNSLFSRETVLRTYGLESRVCYLGVDVKGFKPTGEPKEGFVVGLGGLYAAKGPDRALRALATIPDAARPPFLWIGNMSPSSGYAKSLADLARSLQVRWETRIRVPDAELVSILSRASVLLYTPRLEPFGLAPLEANACGTSVVGIAEGGLRESIHHGANGRLVNHFDPDELGRLVAELTGSRELAREEGANARRHVENHWAAASGMARLTNELSRTLEDFRRIPGMKSNRADITVQNGPATHKATLAMP
ncbi:MAG TPA: glycosyltransferase family 4 protein [Verrucomicrobiae bacterium]|nr:glycosyltransferase family 4 protein [Verrucomicrobiae bacterium]